MGGWGPRLLRCAGADVCYAEAGALGRYRGMEEVS